MQVPTVNFPKSLTQKLMKILCHPNLFVYLIIVPCLIMDVPKYMKTHWQLKRDKVGSLEEIWPRKSSSKLKIGYYLPHRLLRVLHKELQVPHHYLDTVKSI